MGENPSPHRGLEPASVLRLAFLSKTVLTEPSQRKYTSRPDYEAVPLHFDGIDFVVPHHFDGMDFAVPHHFDGMDFAVPHHFDGVICCSPSL